MKHIIKTIKLLVFILCFGVFTNCSDYLDVVPDGVATLDNAFSNRINSEKFLFSCYNMLPNQNDPFTYPGNMGADEMWYNDALKGRSGARIARNEQNAADPYHNYWDGRGDGRNLWIGIRDCNIFLENIERVPDLQAWERARWISEVKFIKAYLHFFLVQLYGPIPIVDTNLSVDSPPEEVRVFREPVDSVINYVVNLLDESMENLPGRIEETITEMGRITKPIAASVKAKALVWAASPLFNGNQDYTNFKDKRGIQLISSQKDNAKWERALEAIIEAIDICHENGHALFRYQREFEAMSDTTLLKYTLRGSVSERPMQNPETVWAHPAFQNANQFQNYCTPNFEGTPKHGGNISEIGATLKVAEQYYTNNGVPIDEDPSWNYLQRYEMRRDTGSFHQYYISKGETTANLNYYREPRFYAHLAFDRSLYEMLSRKEAETIVIKNKSGDPQGLLFSQIFIPTGYFIKKLVSFRTAMTTSAPYPWRFSIPNIRLADLYLLRAEAENEVKEVPDNDVYQWVDSIRLRAGLEGVVDSWSKYSSIPGKPTTKEGMRQIIKRERLIELAFEGERPFDLRRWKDALRYQNEPVQGWDIQGIRPEDYYQVTTIFDARNFTTKDYLQPLRLNSIIKNSNLVQNPGW